MLALPAQIVLADDVERRIADFWKRVDAMGPSDLLTAGDLGGWALNVIERDPGAGITVADFRAQAAGMQDGFDRAGAGLPPGIPLSSDVEARIARFWQRIDALGQTDVITATDLGQWAINVIDRDPNKRIRVGDFRVSTAGMQDGFDHARSLPAPSDAATERDPNAHAGTDRDADTHPDSQRHADADTIEPSAAVLLSRPAGDRARRHGHLRGRLHEHRADDVDQWLVHTALRASDEDRPGRIARLRGRGR